jgi:chemotaxis signal transduction protein
LKKDFLMKKSLKAEKLEDQSNALKMYLQALLNEVDVAEDDSVLNSPQIDSQSALQMPVSVKPCGTGTQTIHEAQDQPETPPETISSTASVAYIDTPGQVNSESAVVNDRDKQHEPPEWAIPRFQVLTFSLGNMQMAAPLDKLNGIIPFPERLTALPGQSHWFLGLARNRNQNVQVIDLAAVIQPQHRQGRGEECSATSTRYILLVDEGRWGILCNSISTVLTLEPQQVQWQRSNHVDFILGTAIDQMQSVLCVDDLINRLNSGDLV